MAAAASPAVQAGSIGSDPSGPSTASSSVVVEARDGEQESGKHDKRRKGARQPLLVHPLPQSIAPWHMLPYCRREVHHLAGLLRVSVRSNMAKARKRWQRHRQAVREKGAQMQSSGGRKSGLHLHLLRLRRRDSDVQHDSRDAPQTPTDLAIAAAERGLDRQRALDIQGAIAAFQEAHQHRPDNAYFLACLSKQWSDITFIPTTPRAEAKSCAEKGLALAEQAVEMAPDYALGHIAAGVGRGRLTFFVDNRTKVELAAAARRDALAALEADPESDLAYHLLGRWHYEMAQLNFVVRTMIRVVFGTALAPGSHEEALDAFQRAVDLNPDRLIHRVELARSALRVGQTTRAVRQLMTAVDMDVEDINAHLTRLDGVEMLEKLRKQGKLRDLLQPALPVEGMAAPPEAAPGQARTDP
eukprot:CAMPEP_0206135816 /NCGR_PEP_ID=MMETSP1473-20131121/1081_1 /ASSEMBLY_ACC=CAM_ASM_001109 /TAXON_ID=1461547 /ORGANISM="Stichococcus sp, Strain RCC1054" /LENGTH=413 /DNA_ID=CAMNT_0053527929 /DNA_START=227 /DNA_END=1469 /DNA_ORIENTATION=+